MKEGLKFNKTARFIKGRNIVLRDVEVGDAEFIYSLRTDERLGRFLSATEGGVESQINYILNYKKSNDTFYFLICGYNGEKFGTVRIYDIQGDSFCWGSWIVRPNVPNYVGIESALAIYTFAFEVIGFKKSHFDVRKENKRVLEFHLRMGAKIIREDELNIYLDYSYESFLAIKPKYNRYLPIQE